MTINDNEPKHNVWLKNYLAIAAKTFMVAERLLDLRSPIAFSSISPASTMDSASASPGADYLRPPLLDYPDEEISVEGIIVKSGVAAGIVALGAHAMAEAKEVVVQNLVKVFGKYQNIATDLSDIQENTLDSKQPDLDDTKDAKEQQDPATASVIDKRTKIEEAIAANTNKTKSDIDVKTKKISAEGMLAIQEDKYTKFIAELFEQQQKNLKEELQTMGEKHTQKILAMETTIRQKDGKIEELETRLNKMENKDATKNSVLFGWSTAGPPARED